MKKRCSERYLDFKEAFTEAVSSPVVKYGSVDMRLVIISSRKAVVLGSISSFGILHRVVV
jgi:hypothetical protein